MLGLSTKWSKSLLALVALVGLDIMISLPIMGATYRPFSWMAIAPADAATLYPVIQNAVIQRLWFEDDESASERAAQGQPSPIQAEAVRHVRVSAQVSPGARVALQRTTDLMDADGWQEVSATTATERVVHLIDTNPISRAVFYRVTQLLEGLP